MDPHVAYRTTRRRATVGKRPSNGGGRRPHCGVVQGATGHSAPFSDSPIDRPCPGRRGVGAALPERRRRPDLRHHCRRMAGHIASGPEGASILPVHREPAKFRDFCCPTGSGGCERAMAALDAGDAKRVARQFGLLQCDLFSICCPSDFFQSRRRSARLLTSASTRKRLVARGRTLLHSGPYQEVTAY